MRKWIVVFVFLYAHLSLVLAQDDIIGKWQRTDGHTVEFFHLGNGVIEGRIVELGPLGEFGFRPGETSFKLSKVRHGVYKGKVKYRWKDGGEEWRKTTQKIKQNEMRGTGLWLRSSISIIGVWKRTDGHIVKFTTAAKGIIEGHIVDVGPLQKYHFKNGEKTFELKMIGSGVYKGKVKFRWTDGRQQWKATTQKLLNNKMQGVGDWIKQ